MTRKITHGVGPDQARAGQSELALGNLDSQRDWGFAGDYVEAMWLMLQQDEPDDYVVSTDTTHSVREFCEIAFAHVGLDWEQHVVLDERFVRPAEVDLLIGDSSKARATLGWKPKMAFEELVTTMVDADLALLSGQLKAALNVAVLAGGVGAARFLAGLVRAVDPAEVTAIVNVGDDTELHGLHISPDLDTVTYTLAGAINPETGWGLAGETWQAMDTLARYGGARLVPPR